MTKEFYVKEEHIKLLKAAYIGWEDCEYGAPAIDCKRPYGNSSVTEDIKEILGVTPTCCPHCEGELDNGGLSDEGARILHEGTQDTLEIMIALSDLKPGFYRLVDSKWGKIDD